MSAVPAGWGFRDAAALDRLANTEPPKPKIAQFQKGRYVSKQEIAEYAATLTAPPTPAQVQSHFGCSRDSAYRYRYVVLDLIAKR